MKVLLKYDPENYEDIDKAMEILNSSKNQLIVDELYSRLIRPFYKHGYSDSKVNTILDKLGDEAEYLIEFFNSTIKSMKSEEE